MSVHRIENPSGHSFIDGPKPTREDPIANLSNYIVQQERELERLRSALQQIADHPADCEIWSPKHAFGCASKMVLTAQRALRLDSGVAQQDPNPVDNEIGHISS